MREINTDDRIGIDISSDKLITWIEKLPLNREKFRGQPTSRQFIWFGRQQVDYDTPSPHSIDSGRNTKTIPQKNTNAQVS